MATKSQTSPEGRIDRRITPRSASKPPDPAAPIVFKNTWGDVDQVFHSTSLGMPCELAAALSAAFQERDAGGSPQTRRHKWRALRLFGSFLQSESILSAREINAGTIQRYLASMDVPTAGKRISIATMGLRLALIRPLLEQVEQANPELFGSPLNIPWSPFSGLLHEPKVKDRLNERELKVVLAACYMEIDEAWAIFQQGQEIVARPEAPPPIPRGQSHDRWLWQLHRFGHGAIPTTMALREAGVAPWPLSQWGGMTKMARYLHLVTNTMAPFYIALAIQLAANPDPLREIRRDCLVSHPVDENRVFVEWIKHKSGHGPKLQRRSFDRRKRRSAPRLIEMLLEMTQPLVAHAPPHERDKLFLVRIMGAPFRKHDHPAGVVSAQTTFEMIRRFIERNNRRITEWNSKHRDRPQPLLPMFNAGQLRGSTATQHYLKTQGDLTATGAVLNHANLVTTDRYVEGPAARRFEQETIAGLQRLMVSWITSPQSASVPTPIRDAVTAQLAHRCLAPGEQRADGTIHICRHIAGCLVCPGLIVPVDAEHLARILQARDHLSEAQDLVDPERWRLFYAPSLQVLEQDLLPVFAPELHLAAARLLPSLPPLPDIE